MYFSHMYQYLEIRLKVYSCKRRGTFLLQAEISLKNSKDSKNKARINWKKRFEILKRRKVRNDYGYEGSRVSFFFGGAGPKNYVFRM